MSREQNLELTSGHKEKLLATGDHFSAEACPLSADQLAEITNMDNRHEQPLIVDG
jgi:hypothetical protein